MWSLLLLALLCLSRAECSQVLGCNGMVRSNYKLDLTRITLHLHTQDDILKFSTDCAPNDGYFFIPFSELEGVKQKITIKLQAPDGWNFKRNALEINVDFKTDVCTLGEDVVFEFVGFSVGGKVVSHGLDTGPEGVRLELSQGSDPISSVESGVDGEFLFQNVPPGAYSLQASHLEFNVTDSVLEVVVSVDAVDVGSSIEVLGYDVSGNVLHEKIGIEEVHILLISAKSPVSSQSDSCLQSIGKLENELKQIPLLFCVSVSNQEGKFKLKSVPPGEYTIRPTYKSDRTKFQIRPELLKIVITHSNLVLDSSFQVTGFEVYGSVVNLRNGEGLVGIEGVKVELSREDGQRLETSSDNFGAYHFSEIQAGSYAVAARMIGYEFEELSIHLTPSHTEIPTLFPSKFEISGKFELKKVVNLDEFIQNLKIEFFSDKSFEASLEKDLSFRILLPKGNYRFSPKLPDHLIAKGIIFTPESINVTVTNTPLTGFLFSQILSSILVKIHCIDSCVAFNTVLIEKSTQQRLTQATTRDDVTGRVEYKDLLMGEYSVELVEGMRCWRGKVATIAVGKEGGLVEFHQGGFILEISSSHEAMIELTHSSGKYGRDHFLSMGDNMYCLPLSGVYQATPKSCHRFESESETFDTSQPRKIQLKAVSHQANAIIIADTSYVSSEAIKLKVESLKSGKILTLEPSKISLSEENRNFSILEFSFFAAQGENLNLEPLAGQLLFSPSALSVTVEGDSCPVSLGSFSANRGSVVRGRVEPPADNVLVELRITAPTQEVLTTHTDVDGAFSFGPLAEVSSYEIHPSSPGVQFEEKETNLFIAHRLGSVVVLVEDEQGRPLSSVLVSMHCGRIRMNNLTSESGRLAYTQLSACQYYVKPTLKEYSFTPNGEIVEVGLDKETERRFVGHKVQYSAYGRVASLSGHPQGDIEVSARGVSDLCLELEEQGVSDWKGEFRILGLKLNCQYQISVDTRHTPRVENVVPDSYLQWVEGEDLKQLRFRLYNRTEQHELTGNLVGGDNVMDRMQVKLYQESTRGLVHISNIQVGPGGFFKFSLPRRDGTDGKEFLLMADSKSRIQGYTIWSEQAVVSWEEGRRHTTVKFRAEIVDDSGEKGGSYLYLTLVLIAVSVVSRFSRKIKETTQKIFGR